jgi:hypothetical protein
MASVDIDLSSYIAAQAFASVDEETKNKLILEALQSILDGEKIKKLLQEQALKIAKEEIQSQIQGDTEIRSKIVSLINDAFKVLLKDEEGLKAKLAEGLVQSLVKDRY